MTFGFIDTFFDAILAIFGLSDCDRRREYEKHEHETRARLMRGENVDPEEVQEEPQEYIPWWI